MTEFTSLTYVQSGHYYGTQADGKEVIKCRGVDKGSISRETVESILPNQDYERILPARLTRFYGAGIALVRGLDAFWCKWLTEPKNLSLQPGGKRIHSIMCTHDDENDKHALVMGVWHETDVPHPGGVSKAFPVEWINPDKNMTQLDEMRRSEHDYEVE